MTKIEKIEKNFKRGLLTYKSYQEQLREAEAEEKKEISFDGFVKGDRVKIKFVDDKNKLWHRISGKTLEFQVLKRNDGYNSTNGHNQHGKSITTFITKEYVEKNNVDTRNLMRVDSLELGSEYTGFIEVTKSEIESIEYNGLNVKYDKWIQKAFDYANLNTEDCEIIDKAINKYKALRELPADKKEEVYNNIRKSLGY